VAIGQGDEPQRSKPRDPTSFILMPPNSPEDPLAHVENAPVFEIASSIKPKRLAFN
jgi:hypothetical protein